MKKFSLDSSFTAIENYLKLQGVIQPNEFIIAVEKPGEGNMNVVLRIKTDVTSYILKQSRAYVQKYPQIPAPLHRIQVEYQFYNNLKKSKAARSFPKILHFDPNNYTLIQEDLGNIQDLTTIYDQKSIAPSDVTSLIELAQLIHKTPIKNTPLKNKELRQLNHQHIFVLPFEQENGFNLNDVQTGLQQIAEPFKNDEELKTIIKSLGELYLSEGEVLIHGDYYPGSWVKRQNSLFVIDPEFSFLGFAEFDLGVMAAHVIMATGNKQIFTDIKNSYIEDFSMKITQQIAGIEIMRRIIGLAQLPLTRSLSEKERLLALAKNLILQ